MKQDITDNGRLLITTRLSIGLDEIQLTAIHAQGAGGQHVNKTSSAIHLRFDIAASTLPDRYKQALLTMRHHLISETGIVIIKAQEYRSQDMNRQAALSRLQALIHSAGVTKAVRRTTGPSRNARRKRTDEKVKRGQLKVARQKVVI